MYKVETFTGQFNTDRVYNTKIKVAGNHIEFRRYKYAMRSKLKGAEATKERPNFGNTNTDFEYKFYANLRRTRQQAFDIISANVRGNKDYNGDHQRIKFMTLTYENDVKIENMDQAFLDFTDFIKRLSYHFFKVKKNVLKYFATWELQPSGKIHFHILFFNMPYISNKPEDGYPLMKLWGHGFVGINALKRKNGKNIDLDKVAGYIVKYMTKGTEVTKDGKVKLLAQDQAKDIYTYENYLKHGLLNRKKYFASKGLEKPKEYKAFMDADQFKIYIARLKELKGFKKNQIGNYLKAKNIDMKINGSDQIINSLWVAYGTLTAKALDWIEYVNLFIQAKFKTIFKSAITWREDYESMWWHEQYKWYREALDIA